MPNLHRGILLGIPSSGQLPVRCSRCILLAQRPYTTSRACRAPSSESKQPSDGESSSPVSNRARRFRELGRDVQDVFLRSEAGRSSAAVSGSISTPGATFETSRDERRTTSTRSPPGPVDGRSSATGRPEGFRPQNTQFRSIRPTQGSASGRANAVDVRSMGAARPDASSARFVVRRQTDPQTGKAGPRKGGDAARGSKGSRDRSRKTGAPPRKRRSRNKGQIGVSADDMKAFELREALYNIERLEASKLSPIVHDPASLPERTQVEVGPSTPGTASGQRSSLEGGKAAVEFYVKHKTWVDKVQLWENQRERSQTLNFAEGMQRELPEAKRTVLTRAEVSSEDQEPEAEPKKADSTADVYNLHVSGAYEPARLQPKEAGKTSGILVRQQTARNSTYERGNEVGLQDKIQSILRPATPKHI